MGKGYVNQHIVPKVYLDRFAEKKSGKPIIGVRFLRDQQLKLFTSPTSDVGYIKNYYDVTDKDDEKHWEHFLAEQIDSLCGKPLDRIISSITLSQGHVTVLGSQEKDILSKIIIAQLMRVPQSVNYVKEIYPRIAEETKKETLSALSRDLLKKYGKQINNLYLSDQTLKEITLNHAFDPETFELYCSVIKKHSWIAYVNGSKSPAFLYLTSDNPVVVESFDGKSTGLFNAGLNRSSTCIFFPLTPRIAIAIYSSSMTAFHHLDGHKFILDDAEYIMEKNKRIAQQAFKHTFFPMPLYKYLLKEQNSGIITSDA